MKLMQAYQRHPMVLAKRPLSDAPTVVLMGGGPRCQLFRHVVVACSHWHAVVVLLLWLVIVVRHCVASLLGFVIVVLCCHHPLLSLCHIVICWWWWVRLGGLGQRCSPMDDDERQIHRRIR